MGFQLKPLILKSLGDRYLLLSSQAKKRKFEGTKKKEQERIEERQKEETRTQEKQRKTLTKVEGTKGAKKQKKEHVQ